MNSAAAGLVAHGASIRSMAKKDIALQRDPLAAILVTMRAEPFLLGFAIRSSPRRREVRDGHMDSLLLGKRKRFQGTKQPVLENRVQFAYHELIVARGFPQGSLLRSWRQPLQRVQIPPLVPLLLHRRLRNERLAA